MLTTVDILCFYQHQYNQLLKVKYVLNLDILKTNGAFTNYISGKFIVN